MTEGLNPDGVVREIVSLRGMLIAQRMSLASLYSVIADQQPDGAQQVQDMFTAMKFRTGKAEHAMGTDGDGLDLNAITLQAMHSEFHELMTSILEILRQRGR